MPVVEDAYEIVGEYRIRHSLSVCHCKHERELLKTPLREIPAGLLAEYTGFVRCPVGWRLAFDLADVLTLVVTAHGDIDNLLVVWDAAADPAAAIHMAALRQDVLHHTGRTHFHSPYLDEFPEAADKIGAFLMRSQTIPRIEAAFFMVTDPRLQQLLSDAIYLE